MKLKKLERAWKALALRTVCALMRRRTRAEPIPDWGTGPHHILFLRQDRIGDAIISSGVLRALASISPLVTVDVVASTANAPILQRDPSVSTVHIFDKKRPATFPALTRRLRAEKYDVVIDCMMTAPSMTGLLLMLASGARHRVGLAGRGIDEALTLSVERPIDRPHIIDLTASMAVALGVDRSQTDWSPKLSIGREEIERAQEKWPTDRENRRRLLINLSAGRSDRWWPDEHFIEVIRAVRSAFPDLDVGLVGAPAEAARVSAVAEASGAVPLSTPALDDLLAILVTADFVFTPDTSVTHMASAVRVPALVLFQELPIAAQWGLYGVPGVNLVTNARNLSDVPAGAVVPEVLQFIRNALQGGLPGQPVTREVAVAGRRVDAPPPIHSAMPGGVANEGPAVGADAAPGAMENRATKLIPDK